MSAPAATPRSNRWPALACALAGAAVFQFFGNANRGYIDSASLFYWWGFQWFNPASETEHGLLILGISGWLFWRNLRMGRSAGFQPAFWGCRLEAGATSAMALGLALHAIGFAAQQARVSIIALLIFVWGVIALAGSLPDVASAKSGRWGAAAAFPLGFLVFAIPLNVLDSVGFWLRLWVIHASAGLAHAAGIGVVQNGTQLLAPDGRYNYDVAAACSGVRSLMALAALALLAGYLNFRSWRRRGAVLLLCFPLVYLGNVARIAAIVFAAHWGGQAWGERAHAVMGYGIFAIVLGGVLAGIALLRRWAPEGTADEGQGTGDREQVTGDRGQGTGDGGQKTEDRVRTAMHDDERCGAREAGRGAAVGGMAGSGMAGSGMAGPDARHPAEQSGPDDCQSLVDKQLSGPVGEKTDCHPLIDKWPWAVAVAIVAVAAGEMIFLRHLASLPPRGEVGVVLAADGKNPAELPAILGREWVGLPAPVSAIEREILPADTGYARMDYVATRDGRHVFLSIVLSGRDRTSIHRPELCLVGQGWTIAGAGETGFQFPGSGGAASAPVETFPATLLHVRREVTTSRGREVVPQVVAYWFVGGDSVVATHWRRLALDAWNRVAHARADRWAYVLMQTDAMDGEPAALARLLAVLNETLPAFQRPVPVR